jgi:hypothetical protein
MRVFIMGAPPAFSAARLPRLSRSVFVGLVGNVLKVALSRPILLMVAKVYIPVLFPLTFLIALIATATDSALGFNGLLPDDRAPARRGAQLHRRRGALALDV